MNNVNNNIIKHNIENWAKLSLIHPISSFPIENIPFETLFHYKDTILDYGCGRGRVTKMLIERGYKNIQACDPSKQICEQAKKDCPGANIIHIKSPTSPLIKENFFKGILLIAVLSSVIPYVDRKKLVENLHKCLVPNGKIIIGDFGYTDNEIYQERYKLANIEPFTFLTQDNIYIHHFTENEFFELLTPIFRIIKIETALIKSIHGRSINSYTIIAEALND